MNRFTAALFSLNHHVDDVNYHSVFVHKPFLMTRCLPYVSFLHTLFQLNSVLHNTPVLCHATNRFPLKFPEQIIKHYDLSQQIDTESIISLPKLIAVLHQPWAPPVYHQFLGTVRLSVPHYWWSLSPLDYSVSIYVNTMHLQQLITKRLQEYIIQEYQRFTTSMDPDITFTTNNITPLTRQEKKKLLAMLHTQDIQLITSRIIEDIYQSTIEKTFCFTFQNVKQSNQIASEFKKLFKLTARTIKSHAFNVIDYEKTCMTLSGIIRRTSPSNGCTMLITCNGISSPPVASILFSPDSHASLEFIGGITGSMLSLLLHKLYLKDPFTTTPTTQLISCNFIDQATQHIQHELMLFLSST